MWEMGLVSGGYDAGETLVVSLFSPKQTHAKLNRVH